MAKLTGQAAIDYIRKNPASSYKVLDYGSIGQANFDKVASAGNSYAQYNQKLKEQEAQKAANPDRGFFGNMIYSATSPLRYIAGGLSQAVQMGNLANNQDVAKYGEWKNAQRKAGVSNWQNLSLDDYLKNSGSEHQASIKNVLLDQNEVDQAVNNPFGTWAGETIKAGTYLIPGGGLGKGASTLAKAGAAAKAGAMSGGLWNVGQGIKEGKDIFQIADTGINGALTGALTGGGLSLAGSAFKGLKNKIFEIPKTKATTKGGNSWMTSTGKKLEDQGTTMQYVSSGGRATARTKPVEAFKESRDTIVNGVKKYLGPNEAVTPESIDKLWDVAGNLRENALPKIKWQGTSDKLINDAAKKLKAHTGMTLEDSLTMVRSRVTDIIESKSGSAASVIDPVAGSYNMNAGTLFDIAGETVEGANVFNNKMNSSMSNRMAYKTNAVDSVLNEISNGVLKKNPQYAEGNAIFLALYKDMPGVVETMNGGRVSLTNGGRPNFASVVQPTFERKLGEGLQGIGRTMQNLGNKKFNVNFSLDGIKNAQATKQIGNFAGALGNVLQQPALNKMASFGAGMAAGGLTMGKQPIQQVQALDPEVQSILDMNINDLYQRLQPQTIQEEQGLTAQAAYQTALQMGARNPTEAVSLAKYLMESQKGGSSAKTISTTAAEKITDQQAALNELYALKEAMNGGGGQEFDPTFVKGIRDATNSFNPNRSLISSMLGSVSQKVARAIEGNRVTDTDYKRYEANVLPSLGMSKDAAMARVDQIISQLENRYTSMLQNYANAGYDLTEFTQ